MVLSKTVRTGGQRDRRTSESPWGGTNLTVARIPSPKKSRFGAVGEADAKGPRRGGRDSNSYGKLSKDDSRRALKMQRALATVSYHKRASVKTKLEEYDSFDKFNLLPVLKEALLGDALKGLTDVKPTPVQRLALAAMLPETSNRASNKPAPKEFLLAAETGSGKTLAYLLPAINGLKIAEAEDADIQKYNQRRKEEIERQKAADPDGPKRRNVEYDEPHPTMARPKVVVLVPTSELVDQVGAVVKSLAHVVKFRSEKLSASLSPQIIQRNLYSHRGVDLVISTPSLLASIAESDPNVLARVTHLVVDEADSLLDRSFASMTTSIMDRAAPSLKQLIICSATIPRKLDNYLSTNYPDMMRITTPNLHAIPRRVVLGVINVSKPPYHNNKLLACADAIYSIGREALKTQGQTREELDMFRIMVFVNERETCQEVADYLVQKGIQAVALNRDTDENRGSHMLDEFTSKEPLRIPTPVEPPSGLHGQRSLPNVKVIVATDLASRGIDTYAVRHVILYDVPHTTIDFIHRLGRAGRMGRRGRGIVLVGNNDRKDVVAEVKESMFMGKALV